MKITKDIAQRWGIKPWLKIRIDRHPAFLREIIEPLCTDNPLGQQGVCDLAFVAPTSAAEWKQKARRLRPAIDPDGVIWVLYPKDAFREKYNFDGSLREMVDIVRAMGLKNTKTAVVSEELHSVRFNLEEA